MRQFKFRVWDKNHKEFLIRELDPKYGWVYSRQSTLRCSNLEFLIENTKDYIVSQFTGLVDKNKKEIFEGDIIEGIIPNDTKINMREVVKWREEYTGYYPWVISSPREVKIIGNIFENPDLLTSNK